MTPWAPRTDRDGNAKQAAITSLELKLVGEQEAHLNGLVGGVKAIESWLEP